MPIRRSNADHGDDCRMARALDVVGDQWSLVLARELMLGPKRYSELESAVLGISPAVLTERLRTLEQAGVIERVASEGRSGYALTTWGRELDPVLQALGRWYSGAPAGGPPGGMTPDALVQAIRTMAPASAGRLRPVALRLRDDRRPSSGELRCIVHSDGGPVRFEPDAESGDDVAATVVADATTFARVLFDALPLVAAQRDGAVTVVGDDGAVTALVALLAAPVDQGDASRDAFSRPTA